MRVAIRKIFNTENIPNYIITVIQVWQETAIFHLAIYMWLVYIQ